MQMTLPFGTLDPCLYFTLYVLWFDMFVCRINHFGLRAMQWYPASTWYVSSNITQWVLLNKICSKEKYVWSHSTELFPNTWGQLAWRKPYRARHAEAPQFLNPHEIIFAQKSRSDPWEIHQLAANAGKGHWLVLNDKSNDVSDRMWRHYTDTTSLAQTDMQKRTGRFPIRLPLNLIGPPWWSYQHPCSQGYVRSVPIGEKKNMEYSVMTPGWKEWVDVFPPIQLHRWEMHPRRGKYPYKNGAGTDSSWGVLFSYLFLVISFAGLQLGKELSFDMRSLGMKYSTQLCYWHPIHHSRVKAVF